MVSWKHLDEIFKKLKIVSTVHGVDSLAHMLIVFDSKSSLTHYTFDKIKFLHISIILLYLIFYFSKFMFKSWLVAHENWVSVESFLVPGNCKNAGFCTIYPRPPAVRTPLRGPSTRLLNRIEYTSFWGSYAPDCTWIHLYIRIRIIYILIKLFGELKMRHGTQWLGRVDFG